MPTLDWAVGKAVISAQAQLKVDLKEQNLALVENGGQAVDVGDEKAPLSRNAMVFTGGGPSSTAPGLGRPLEPPALDVAPPPWVVTKEVAERSRARPEPPWPWGP